MPDPSRQWWGDVHPMTSGTRGCTAGPHRSPESRPLVMLYPSIGMRLIRLSFWLVKWPLKQLKFCTLPVGFIELTRNSTCSKMCKLWHIQLHSAGMKKKNVVVSFRTSNSNLLPPPCITCLCPCGVDDPRKNTVYTIHIRRCLSHSPKYIHISLLEIGTQK
jgi:hypothetical protein